MASESKAIKRKATKTPKSEPVSESSTDNKDEKKKESSNFKYGPLPTFPQQRIWTRTILVLSLVTIVYFSAKGTKNRILAKQEQSVRQLSQNVICSDSYKSELEKFEGCVPEKCGRFISDYYISQDHADGLLKMAKKGLAFGGSDGGASILDLHSGALSLGKQFVNIYKLDAAKNVFNKGEWYIYKEARSRIQHAVANNFNIDGKNLFLTHPTFFSQLTDKPPATVHDEYWHSHIDKDTYKSFHYTALLYLNDYGTDFQGGRFVFVESTGNSTVEPRKGRVSMFTSGAENVHLVEKVTQGVRYALTVSFTCDPSFAIDDPGYGSE